MSSTSKLKSRLIQTVSWIAVAAIFLFILSGIVPKEKAQELTFLGRVGYALQMLREVLSNANLVGIVALCLSYFAFLVFIDTAGTRWVIERFNCKIPFREMLPARAITFLIAVLNYQAGQLAIPLYLKRAHKVPLLEGSGSIFFVAALDLFIVMVLGFCGALFVEEANLSRQILFGSSIGIAFYIGNAFFWRNRTIQKPMLAVLAKIPGLRKVTEERSIFHGFQVATLTDYIKLLFLRLPIHAGIFASMYFLVICFGYHIPFRAILVYFPVVMIIGTLPGINVGSLGASQASVVYFFKSYAPEATLFAVSLTWALAINLLKVALGAIFLTQHSARLFRPEGETDAAETSAALSTSARR